jgi:putative heme-binding domain-containing protein
MGFVVQEAADKIMVRNIAGQEIAIAVDQVTSRATDPKSLMPEGLLGNLAVKDFAALLDYLEALAKGGN